VRLNKRIVLVAVIAAIAGFVVSYNAVRRLKSTAESTSTATPPPVPASIYEIGVRDIDGGALTLDRYRGKTLLIVNVASKCRFTPQYEGLQKLYQTYSNRGLVVLGFPANDFAMREPGTDAEIKEFCTTQYQVTFPLFSKIEVAGEEIHPLYRYLTDARLHPEHGKAVSWNFNKYLVDSSGKLVGHFGSTDTPESPALIQAIEAALDRT